MILRRTFLAACLAIVPGAIACAPPASAGGGPENVLVIVNSASWASVTVANHFIQLRDIPPGNVFSVEWTDGIDGIDGETLRNRILHPALEAMRRRGLMGQIDYIVYSSDFPYVIDLSSDLAGAKLNDQKRPNCSLNSTTYLWHLLFGKSALAMEPRTNRYTRFPLEGKLNAPVHGFRSWYGWGRNGDLYEAGGQPYMLSTLLAVTSGRGNSVREATSYLQASAKADGTFPKGTIYFSKTDDIRSKTRAELFAPAVSALKKLGVKSEVIASAMPAGRSDVQGAMTGISEFSWARTHSKILPGAICENFTSFGGIMREDGGQTPLTEFLRYGAAGSSGTVVEPFAIAEKFPSPMLQVYYALGCTLAEAYYQSVFSPAQLLIVGDPLCRPWANIPQVQVEGVKQGAKVSGTLELKPTARLPKGGKIERWELFVDGRRAAWQADGETLTWNSEDTVDGYHELRVVGIEASAIESQGRAIIGVMVENHGQTAQLATLPKGTVRWDETVKIRARAPSMASIVIVQDDRLLGRITGESGQIEINPRRLGLGPVTLQAVGLTAEGVPGRAAPPVRLTVQPPQALPAITDAGTNLAKGLVLRLADGKTVPIQDTQNPSWLAGNGVEAGQPFALQGVFDVPVEDVYQFQVWHFGELKLAVDNKGLYTNQAGDYTQKFVPVALAAGKHRLTIVGRSTDDVRLRVLFGGPGALSLNGTTFRHPR